MGMGIAKKVAYNTVVQVTGRAISIVVTLFLVRYLTSYLKVEGFGEYTTAITFAGIFSVIADFGLSTIVARDISARKEKIDEYIGNVLALRAVFAFATMAFAPIVAWFLPYSTTLKMAILIIALASYILSLNQVFVGVFQARSRMDQAVLGDVVGRLIIFAVSIIFIKMGFGLVPILSVMIGANVVNLIISWLLVRRVLRPRFIMDWERSKKILLEMLPMGIVLVLAMIYTRVDMIILSILKGSEATGVYGVAYKYVDILILLPSFFMGAVFPFIVRTYGEEKEKFANILQRATEVVLIFALPMGVLITMFSDRFVRILAPEPGFAGAALPLKILVIGLFFSYLTQVPNYTLVAIKKQFALIWVYVFLIVLNVILNLILIPKYSYNAAAAVTVFTEILAFVFSWYLLIKFTDFRMRIKYLGLLAAGLLMASCVALLQESFIPAIIISSIVYGAALLLFKVVDSKVIRLKLTRG
jgi:O-antigen/teichoic acid export membrane protein